MFVVLRLRLLKDEEFKGQVKRVFLGGSYKRSTAIRPKTKNGSTERPDVDLYVVVDGKPWDSDPAALIDDLYAALNRARDDLGITAIKRNRCSIALSMNKADLDVSILLERQDDDLYAGGSIGFRVAKGVTLRFGRAVPITSTREELVEKAGGDLYVTNKKLAFIGQAASIMVDGAAAAQVLVLSRHDRASFGGRAVATERCRERPSVDSRVVHLCGTERLRTL